jgi:hypothetical protein
MVTVAASRSTSGQRSPSSSLRRAPVIAASLSNGCSRSSATWPRNRSSSAAVQHVISGCWRRGRSTSRATFRASSPRRTAHSSAELSSRARRTAGEPADGRTGGNPGPLACRRVPFCRVPFCRVPAGMGAGVARAAVPRAAVPRAAEVSATPLAARAAVLAVRESGATSTSRSAPARASAATARPQRSRIGRTAPPTPRRTTARPCWWPSGTARWRPVGAQSRSLRRVVGAKGWLRRRRSGPGGRGCRGTAFETSFWGTPAWWRGERVPGNRCAHCNYTASRGRRRDRHVCAAGILSTTRKRRPPDLSRRTTVPVVVCARVGGNCGVIYH